MISRCDLVRRTRRILERFPPSRVRFLSRLAIGFYPALIGFWFAVAGLGLVCGIASNSPILVVAAAVLLIWAMRFSRRALEARPLQLAPGVALERGRAPALDAAIEDICRGLGCKPPGRVELDNSENACVYAEPAGKLGVRSVLRLGLPLMMAMRAGEFRSVLAHECGHLLRNDHLFARFLNRVEMSWLAATHGENDGRQMPWWIHLLKKTIEPRILPWLRAGDRVVEEQADMASLQLDRHAATAKARVGLFADYGGRLAEPWFVEIAARHAVPPAGYSRLRVGAIRERWNQEEAARHLEALLHLPDNILAAHPTYQRVLEMAGSPPVPLEPPPPPEESAAAVLLGPALPAIEAALDEEFQTLGGQNWRDTHARINQARMTLAAPPGVQSPETAALMGHALLTLGRRHEALEHLSAACREKPEDSGLALARVQTLLATDHPEAVSAAGELLDRHPLLAPQILDPLISFHARRGDAAAAQAALHQLFDFYDRFDRAARERNILRDKDRVEPAELPPAQLQMLQRLLLQQPDVLEARIVRRVLTDFQNAPVHVILVGFGGAARGSKKIAIRRCSEIVQTLPPAIECFVGSSRLFPKLWKRASSFPNAVLLRRTS